MAIDLKRCGLTDDEVLALAGASNSPAFKVEQARLAQVVERVDTALDDYETMTQHELHAALALRAMAKQMQKWRAMSVEQAIQDVRARQ